MTMDKEGFTQPVNLGNPAESTILELAEKIIKLTKSSSKIIRKPLPPDDPVRRCPDISLAKEKLGWQPKIGLEEGLLKTIAYFRERLDLKKK
jgi:UDP-glucuronate decarboxylase